MASSQQMEVVEDSEPERQELRQKLKEDRRRRRGVNTKENHMTTPNSSVAVLQLSKGKAVSNGVIDISDDETPHVRNGAHPSTEVPNAPHKHDEGTQFDSPPVQRDETFEDQTKTGFKPAVLSNLNRLAFVAKLPNPPPRVSQSLSRTPSTDSVKLHHPQPPPRSNKSTSPASYGWDFSEIELSRLLKCISCGIKWTVRKSATQKLAHIKTCARKTHLSHETVKTLIQREINASSLSVAAGTSKGREKEKRKVKDQASVDAPPKTFLEHVVLEDSEGQKKRRRKHGPETVQSVSDTRGTILEKAKLLLQTAPLPPEVESTLGPPMTQAFGKSNLGQNTFGAGMSSSRWNVFTGRDPGYTVTKEYNECPPATQAFRTSRLGIAMKHSSTHPSRQNTPAPSIEHVNTQTALPSIDCTGKACRHDMIGIFSRPRQTNVFPNSNCDESPSRHKVTNGPRDNQEHHLHQDLFEVDNENLWDVDDAVIHFDPDDYVSIGNMDSERFIATESLDVHRDEDNEVCKRGSRSRSLSNVSSSPSETNEMVQQSSHDVVMVPPKKIPKSIRQHTSKHQNKSRSKKQKAQIPAAEEEVDDHELHAMLKKMVLEDEPLYLRILHYEPIHFDVFAKMAEENGIKSKSLKTKIRTFLDQQAISFYGYYAGRRVRR